MSTVSFCEDVRTILVPSVYGATFTCPWMGINQYRILGINIIVSAGSSTNFSAQVQVSNKPDDVNSWANFGAAQTLTSDGGYAFNLADCGFRAMRVVFTRSAGSATFEIIVQSKS